MKDKLKPIPTPKLDPNQEDDTSTQEEIDNMTEAEASEAILEYARYGDCDIDLRNILSTPKWAHLKDYADSQKRTPLHMACANGHPSTVNILLQFKPDVNKVNEGGCSALHHAALNGHAWVTKALVEAGINLSLKNEFGKTALDDCWGKGFEDIENLLLTHDKEIDELIATEGNVAMSAGEKPKPEQGDKTTTTTTSQPTTTTKATNPLFNYLSTIAQLGQNPYQLLLTPPASAPKAKKAILAVE
eukprot:TRINITY_DN66945_c7_g6_i1.p1 TRINITY_DN66945_c7_g6~~TRINITY_DN66945_c7_g6_i1.p1  ORF type:complete len:276 (-),score=48.01 TRINITY_DN66945_c7_g6_i1:511-1245(-)